MSLVAKTRDKIFEDGIYKIEEHSENEESVVPGSS
jgi:hypothetical protein